MLIDIEKNQKFLKLLYSLQNNNSNAVIRAVELAELILDRKVYMKKSNNKYFFSLEENEEVYPKVEKKSGRPKIILNKDEILNLKKSKKTNRQIAKMLKVSEGTIRNFLKEL